MMKQLRRHGHVYSMMSTLLVQMVRSLRLWALKLGSRLGRELILKAVLHRLLLMMVATQTVPIALLIPKSPLMV